MTENKQCRESWLSRTLENKKSQCLGRTGKERREAMHVVGPSGLGRTQKGPRNQRDGPRMRTQRQEALPRRAASKEREASPRTGRGDESALRTQARFQAETSQPHDRSGELPAERREKDAPGTPSIAGS